MSSRFRQGIYQIPSNRTSLACTKGDFKLARVCSSDVSHLLSEQEAVPSQDFLGPGLQTLGEWSSLRYFWLKLQSENTRFRANLGRRPCCGFSPLLSLLLAQGFVAWSALLCGARFRHLSVRDKDLYCVSSLSKVLKSPEGSRYERSPALCFSETHKLSGVSSIYLLNY